MEYIGTVYHHTEDVLGQLTVEEKPAFLMITLSVNDTEVVRFPVSKDSDSNAIIARTRNVLNQTGLVSNPVRVELDEVT